MHTKQDVIDTQNAIIWATQQKAKKEGVNLHKLTPYELSKFTMEAVKETFKSLK